MFFWKILKIVASPLTKDILLVEDEEIGNIFIVSIFSTLILLT